MSPSAGDLLLEHIAPRLRAAVLRCVKPVGAEDPEELIQDAIATAAQMLHNSEAAGKIAPAASVAYYTILHMKSGRRSQNRSRADAMACGTQLDHKSSLLSMEEEVGFDEKTGEPMLLGELLAGRHEDPSEAAGRNLDREQFLATHDVRYGAVVKGTAEGMRLREIPPDGEGGYSRIYQLRQHLAEDLQEYMGEEAIADVVRQPGWRGNLKVKSERVACQADRRKW